MTELRERPRAITAGEGKLYAVAVIAIVYLIAWYELSAPPPLEAARAQAVWIDQLPAAARPAVTPPEGWRVASRDEQVTAPAVVRAPASRPVRVRTRSS